jgi:uncharacterized protein YecE (DUF72 family)
MGSPAKWLIGTSGWSYDHWQGVFYPEDLKSRDWLSFYTRNFSTVEVNSTFYHMPRDKTMDGWRDNTPDGFTFTLKMNGWITHRKKLQGVSFLLKQFFDTARHLEHKLGVILHQLPPSMKKDIPLLALYLKLLPKEMKHAVEFRHESWPDEETLDLLRSHGVAFCIVSAPDLKTHIRATASLAYVRMHGKGGWYASCYSDGDLKEWAQEIVKLAKAGCDGYVYFNNDYAGYAVRNAMTLRRQLDHPSRRRILSVA